MAKIRFRVRDSNGAAAPAVSIAATGFFDATEYVQERAWHLTRGWVLYDVYNYKLGYNVVLTKEGHRAVSGIAYTKPVRVVAGFTEEISGKKVTFTTHALGKYDFIPKTLTTSASGEAVLDIGSPMVSGRNPGFWGFSPYVPYLPWVTYLGGSSNDFVVELDLYTLTIVPLQAKTIGPDDYYMPSSTLDPGGLYSFSWEVDHVQITVQAPDGTSQTVTLGEDGVALGDPIAGEEWPFTLVEQGEPFENCVVLNLSPGIYKIRAIISPGEDRERQFDGLPSEVALFEDKTLLYTGYVQDETIFTLEDPDEAPVVGAQVVGNDGRIYQSAVSTGVVRMQIPPNRYLPALGAPPIGELTAYEKSIIENTWNLTVSKDGFLPMTVVAVSDGNGVGLVNGESSPTLTMTPVFDITFKCRKMLDAVSYTAAYPATLTVDGVEYATDADGEMAIPLAAGAHSYSLVMEGCDPTPTTSLTVTAAADQIIKVYAPMQITFSVTSGGSPVEGAIIEIGEYLGGVGNDTDETDASGVADAISKLAGTYTYYVSKSGKATHTDTIVMDKVPQTIDVVLETGRKITFTPTTSAAYDGPSYLPGAVVIINDVKAVIAAPSYSVDINVPSGIYTYEIDHPYCDAYWAQITVTGSDITLGPTDITPKLLKHTFVVVDDEPIAAPVSGALVTNGAHTATTNVNGVAEIDRYYFIGDASDYDVAKAGFVTHEGDFSLAIPTNHTIVLAWLRYTLDITTIGPDGDALEGVGVVLSNGDELTTNESGLASFDNVHIGPTVVTGAKNAYQTSSIPVNIEGNEAHDLYMPYASTIVLKNPCGLQMKDWVAPVYEDSLVADVFFEVNGKQWCEAASWVRDLINQCFVTEE